VLSKPHMRDHTATSMLNAIRAAFTRVSSPAANSTAQTDSASADAVANATGSGKPRKWLFRNFTRSGQWSRLNANNGVLRSAHGATLSVPVTGPLEGMTLQGAGWSATLNSGRVVRSASRPGSFTIVREN